MDITINYYSPAIFATLVTIFVTFFTLFRNYRFRLNIIFSALGFTGIAWFFLIYLLPQFNNFELTVYFLVFGNLLLFFAFLLLHHLAELPAKKTQIIPPGTIFFPNWIGLVFSLLIIFLGLGFFAYLLDNSGLLVFPENISALILNTLISSSLVFCTSAVIVIIISAFRLIRSNNERDISFEKIFSVIFGLLWTIYSLVFLATTLKIYH